MAILTTHQVDANLHVLTEAPALIQRTDYNASNLPIYIGLAVPTSLASAAVWQIRKLTYTGNNVTLIEFADGNTEMDNIWDNRVSASYS